MITNPGKEIIVLVFIREDEKILLVRQNYGEAYWSLPGGLVEPGETLTAAAIREVKEETSLDISINLMVGIYSKPKENTIAITLEGQVLGGCLKAANEIIECKYFPSDDLPDHVRNHFHQRVEDYFTHSGSAFIRDQ